MRFTGAVCTTINGGAGGCPGGGPAPDDDPAPSYGDPELGDQAGLIPPHFDSSTHTFADGSTTIREAFEHLVLTYGAIGATSAALDAADPAHAPATDILGQPRDATPDLGAYEWP